MLPQTKRAIYAMLKSGFKREEFKVHAKFDKHGQYSHLNIAIYSRNDVILSRVIPMLNNGLDVRLHFGVIGDMVQVWSVEQGLYKTGILTTVDYSYPLGRKYQGNNYNYGE